MDKLSKTIDHLELIRVSAVMQTQQFLHQVYTIVHPSRLQSSDFWQTQGWKAARIARSQRVRAWLSVLTVLGVWGWWDAKLLFSTGLGLAILIWVCRLPLSSFQRDKIFGLQHLQPMNRQLTVGVGSGVAVSVFLYAMLSLWTSLENPWMALSVIGQNAAILAILTLIVWERVQQKLNSEEAQLNQWLADLTHDNPLKRLIAVRQLTHLFQSSPHRSQVSQLVLEAQRREALPSLQPLPELERIEIVEYFQLMLYQEDETLVREALREGLEILELRIKN